MPLVRIIMHWSAGGHNANSSDKRHYHEIVEGDGSRVLGDKLPEANNSTSDGDYAAHVRGFNTGSIGLAMASMAGARESPFKAGSSPITDVQLEAFVEMVAEYCQIYDIPIDRRSVLGHAEVQITHNKPQGGKWDITWLPGMKKPGDPIEVGDRLREMVRDAYDGMDATPAPVSALTGADTAHIARDFLAFLEERAAHR